MEEDPIPYRKVHFSYPELSFAVQQNPISRGKSYVTFLSKALFFTLLIIVIPLFPSRAPDFINQSVLNKFWELIHLLFIGIAVSYGLFSRRNVEMDTERNSRIDNLQSDMSRMFHVSSIFEDGYENPYAFDEKRVCQSRSGRYFLGEPGTFWSEESAVIDEQCKPDYLSFSGNGLANSVVYDERNLIQAWNSQYFQSESMVVKAQPNQATGDQWDTESRSGGDYQPLGLPVRRLKSRSRKRESPQFVNGSESGSGSQGSTTSSDKSRNGEFGDLGPQNLEPKFHEAVASASPIPWRSRSGRTEMREKVSPVTRPSHFRPLSVDEAQFESIKMKSSLRSRLSFSSQANSISSSPKMRSPSHSSSSEALNSKMEDVRKAKSSQGSSPPSSSPSPSPSPSPPKPRNEKVSSSALHARGYSFSSLDENDLRGSKDNLKDSSGGRRDQEMKCTSFIKASSRGKSVRTIRNSINTGLTSEATCYGEMQRKQTGEKVDKTCNSLKIGANGYMKMKNGGIDDNGNESSKQCFDNPIPPNVPKPTFARHEKKEKQEFSEKDCVESEEDLEIEAENLQVSSEEDAAVLDPVKHAGADSDEVDKKAGEFIAKFREQIRLQKTASFERSRGLSIRGNCFR
ncbi:hypothetical protein FNV43_RR18369 [Rhamnella rubrinervis]|uniref:Uncharacterized protein n=1 Tax=Rhamnella rubrinervis TaxID=2594499 RepID=A0A8K0E0M3_9ROSA|nr:hypothetical protein FNV43_RR18369 [Rhamnella rubrinervis]